MFVHAAIMLSMKALLYTRSRIYGNIFVFEKIWYCDDTWCEVILFFMLIAIFPKLLHLHCVYSQCSVTVADVTRFQGDGHASTDSLHCRRRIAKVVPMYGDQCSTLDRTGHRLELKHKGDSVARNK